MIASITIKNIRGIEALEIKPGNLTVVSGSNGTGKSSVIAAIQAVFEGGHDSSMIRHGAEKGAVELTLADGTVIKRTITAKASTLDVTTKDGDKKKAPAAYVAGLASGFALDPIAIITAGKKDRARFLLENSGVTFQPAEIAETTGHVSATALNLEGVDKLRKSIYEQRTALNVRAKESQDTASAIRQSMPAGMDRDYVSELAQVESDLMDRTNEASRLEAEAAEAWTKFEASTKGEYAALVRKLEAERDERLANARINYQSQKDIATREISAEIAELTGRRAELRVKADEQKRATILEMQYQVNKARYRDLDNQVDVLTKSLEKLDALKAKKLAEDGIEGMDIVDGEIVVGGIPFDALNTAQQYSLAFQIAARGAGELPLMICDRAEAFDSAQWEEFKAAAAESGFQIIAARVEDCPLSVEVAA